ncbi:MULTISPECIES: FAD:protein FMN transferase [unclassified Brevundimonas]|uniref:FAD:protein FMN transferase n=1 Tax=unclassified Brevundimonas TaxID=2622653 RepID=UPI0025C1C3F6|nr:MULTISPECIES: FAD:protein FMN transferase [unclassified Brevundimonas]
MKRSSSTPAPIVIGDPVANDFGENRVLIPRVDGGPERPPSDLIWSLDGESMGTSWQVRLIAPPASDLETFRAAIPQELDRIVALFSPWVDDSEISRFNAAPSGFVSLSEPFWALLTRSLDVADDVNGAVDPTLGALVDLWGFGPPGPRPALLPVPSDTEIEAARALCGWNRLRLNRETRSAMQPGGMKLDFSGIAKGHAVDCVSDRLLAMGATSHLVEIGGELKGVGVKPDAQPWWVEIEAVEGSPAPRTVAALYNLAVATSGDWRRSFSHNGIRYSHTIDGSTGRPLDNGLAQVTVFHASAMMADALATAFTVLGPRDGPELATAMGIAVHFIERTADGPVEHMTPAYAAMMEEEA